MASCEQCQDLLLDYLYGLVEEESEIRAHLETCPACQSALEKARQEQQLLAQAAEIIRDVPLFRPPETVAREEHVQVLTLPAAENIPQVLPRKSRRRWLA